MAALGGGVVSYERDTPVEGQGWRVSGQVLLEPIKPAPDGGGSELYSILKLKAWVRGADLISASIHHK